MKNKYNYQVTKNKYVFKNVALCLASDFQGYKGVNWHTLPQKQQTTTYSQSVFWKTS